MPKFQGDRLEHSISVVSLFNEENVHVHVLANYASLTYDSLSLVLMTASVLSPLSLVCAEYIYSSVRVAEWSPLRKELHT